MKEVPNQYKKIVETQTAKIMTAAEKLWPFVEELGDYYECESSELIVIVKKALVRNESQGHSESGLEGVIPPCQNECLIKVNNYNQCGSVSKRGYHCSRLPKHSGNHVACGAKCAIDIW